MTTFSKSFNFIFFIKGIKQRSRTCLFGSLGDLGCIGEVDEIENCDFDYSQQQWQQWSMWSSCMVINTNLKSKIISLNT